MQYSQSKNTYFATRFHLAIAGEGTEDRNLERLTVARCEIDMGNIKLEFHRIYGVSLHTAVSVSSVISSRIDWCHLNLLWQAFSAKELINLITCFLV